MLLKVAVIRAFWSSSASWPILQNGDPIDFVSVDIEQSI